MSIKQHQSPNSCSAGCCQTHSSDSEKGCGHSHDPLTITSEEKAVLLQFVQCNFLPVSRFIMSSSKEEEARFVSLAPVHITAVDDSMETMKKTGRVLSELEKKRLISLDYDIPLEDYDYTLYTDSVLFAYFTETVMEGKKQPGFLGDTAEIELGSIALTELGEKVSALIRIRHDELRDNCRKNLIQYTLKAFSMIPAIHHPLILDMGCGTGVPSLALLEVCNGSIYAVDSDSGSLEWLNEKVAGLNYAHRIKVIQASLFEVNLPVGTFDIILAEGLLNVVGFDKGLPILVNFLKPGGYLIIHDELKDDTEKKRMFASSDLQLLDAFELDENVWWKDYYACLDELIQQEKNVSLFEKEKNEIAEIKKYPEKFRSIYYVLHK